MAQRRLGPTGEVWVAQIDTSVVNFPMHPISAALHAEAVAMQPL